MRGFSISRLMVVVAITGLVMAVGAMAKRTKEFHALAVIQAKVEQTSFANADLARGTGESHRVATNEQMAAYHRSLKIKYELAAWYPWLVVEPDPPVPHPPPAGPVPSPGP
jgi:hypothetical protein